MKEITIPTRKPSYYEQKVKKLFDMAGITINGREDFDVQVNDLRFFRRVLSTGSIGLGESYLDQWWECKKLDEFFSRVIHSGLEQYARHDISTWLAILHSKLVNLQGIKEAYENASFHYDLGNDLYKCMLDKRLTYTCGYWKNATNLDEAQEDKLELTCQKLHLEPGM